MRSQTHFAELFGVEQIMSRHSCLEYGVGLCTHFRAQDEQESYDRGAMHKKFSNKPVFQISCDWNRSVAWVAFRASDSDLGTIETVPGPAAFHPSDKNYMRVQNNTLQLTQPNIK